MRKELWRVANGLPVQKLQSMQGMMSSGKASGQSCRPGFSGSFSSSSVNPLASTRGLISFRGSQKSIFTLVASSFDCDVFFWPRKGFLSFWISDISKFFQSNKDAAAHLISRVVHLHNVCQVWRKRCLSGHTFFLFSCSFICVKDWTSWNLGAAAMERDRDDPRIAPPQLYIEVNIFFYRLVFVLVVRVL